MYNKYAGSGGFDDLFTPVEREHERPPRDDEREIPKQVSRPSLLGSIKLPELNSGTILLIIAALFLISDRDFKNLSKETLVIIAILFILGV